MHECRNDDVMVKTTRGGSRIFLKGEAKPDRDIGDYADIR